MPTELTLTALVAVLFKRRRVILLVAGLGLSLALALSLLAERRYVASGAFVPEGSSGSSGSGALAGLAGQLGLSLPAVGGDSPAGFYATLLQTRALLRRVVAQDFRTVDGRSGSLPDILGLEGTPEERVERAAAWLRNKRFVVSVDRQTSVVQVRVRTFDPLLSAGLTSALLAAVDEYNVATRRSAGANEREFLAARLNEKNEELRVLDDSLEAFLLQNRRITENAPALLFQEDRLRRRVMLQQQVLASLASALEDARIREIRDTPTTTVIEPATVPSEAESRHLIAKAFIGLALGLIFGITAAAAVELVSRRAEPA